MVSFRQPSTLSQEILSFPSDSQSILHQIVPQSAVEAEVVVIEGDGSLAKHGVSVAASDAAGSNVLSPLSQSSVRSGLSETYL